MRNVYVIGIGSTKFGKLDMNVRQMSEVAVWQALKDANLKPSDLQVAYCGYAYSGHFGESRIVPAQVALKEIGIRKIPMTRVESACASSAAAFREAWICVASGLYDVALAFGVEKMTHRPAIEILDGGVGRAIDQELETNYGLLPFGMFGVVVQRRMHEYGETLEQIAKVAVKNRKHASLNPIAQFQKEITVEEVLNSYPVCDPITLFMFCPVSDGASATILASDDFVKKHMGNTPIKTVTSVLTTGTYAYNSTLTNFQAAFDGTKEAYEKAGIGAEDIDVAEVHDACVAAEICHYESLGFCSEGEGGRLVDNGETALGGRIPVNPGGGLSNRGHPLGASGCAQINEIVEQLRGQAGRRQVEGAKVGLAQCWGGMMQGDGCSLFIHVFKK